MKTEAHTITVVIDDKEVPCAPGELLIEVAKRAGIYIPYFCYHPRMDPVGACRMCLVSIEPGPPKPQTACTTRVNDGMVVRTQFSSPDVQQAQQGILEFLLINHPLDCPICDRGGECPLQDQAQDYGPNESRFVEPKRRFAKPVPISSLINLDRERCILCYRCTRFCEEISGDTLIGVMERGPKSYIYPFEGESFDSYFSGNTVQICPVGALTSTPYRFQARPWDLHVSPSTCNMCACGCALQVNVRTQDGNVVRFSAGVNEETNQEWLCDKGRYGNAYVSSPARLTQPMVRRDTELEPVSWDAAFRFLGERLEPVIDTGGPTGMIVGGSLCDEDYYVAQKFARSVLGTNSIDHRLEGGMSADALIGPQLTYDDVLGSDAVVLVGLDAREELPILFLRLRVAATKRGLRLAVVHPRSVALTELADVHVQPLPSTEASIGASVDAALRGSSVDDPDVRQLAEILGSAARPVVLLGPGLTAPEALHAWRSAAEAAGGRMAWLPRRAGTYGALAAGAHPDLLPGWRRVTDASARREVGERWGVEVPSAGGADVAGMLGSASAVLWLVGADLQDVPGDGTDALRSAGVVIVQDVQRSPACEHADIVLPAAAFVEREGTFTDWEGRRLPTQHAVDPPGAARADYAIFAEAARRLGRPIGCRTVSDVRDELDALLDGVTSPVPVGEANVEVSVAGDGELRLLTYRLLYDDGSRLGSTDRVGALTPGAFAEVHPSSADGIADGDLVRVTSGHGELVAPARITDRIRPGVVFVPYRQPGGGGRDLCAPGDMTPVVTLELT